MEIEADEVTVRASRLIWIRRMYPRVLIVPLIVKVWAHGSISFPLFGFYVIAAFLMLLVFSALPVKHLDVVLSENEFKIPVRRRIGFKSINVKVSDIVISDSFVDKLRGTTMITKQGDRIQISLPHYSRKDIKMIKELIRERVRDVNAPTRQPTAMAMPSR